MTEKPTDAGQLVDDILNRALRVTGWELYHVSAFKKKDEIVGCRYLEEYCFYWKTNGECTKNKVYMKKNC